MRSSISLVSPSAIWWSKTAGSQPLVCFGPSARGARRSLSC